MVDGNMFYWYLILKKWHIGPLDATLSLASRYIIKQKFVVISRSEKQLQLAKL